MTGFKCAGLADKALEFVPRFTRIVSTVIFSTASALFATPFVQFDDKRAHPELSGYSEQIVPPSEHNHAAGFRQARKTGITESENHTLLSPCAACSRTTLHSKLRWYSRVTTVCVDKFLSSANRVVAGQFA